MYVLLPLLLLNLPSKASGFVEESSWLHPNTQLFTTRKYSKSRSIAIELDIKTNYYHLIRAQDSYTPEDANLEDLGRVNAAIASHREMLGAGGILGILSLADNSESLN